MYLFSQVAATLNSLMFSRKEIPLPPSSLYFKKKGPLPCFRHIPQGTFSLAWQQFPFLFFFFSNVGGRAGPSGLARDDKDQTTDTIPPPTPVKHAASSSRSVRGVRHSRVFFPNWGRQCSQDRGRRKPRNKQSTCSWGVNVMPEFGGGGERVRSLMYSNQCGWYQMQKHHEFLG